MAGPGFCLFHLQDVQPYPLELYGSTQVVPGPGTRRAELIQRCWLEDLVLTDIAEK